MLLEHEFPGDVRVDREVESLHKAGIEVDVAIYTRNKKQENITNFEWGKVYSKYISKLNLKLSALSLSLPNYFNFWEIFITDILKNNTFYSSMDGFYTDNSYGYNVRDVFYTIIYWIFNCKSIHRPLYTY
jgi:hypothetical protein